VSINKDGLRVATCAFEAAAWHRSVKVACRCGHAAYFQAHGLWWLFQKRRWSDEFKEMPLRFVCSLCLVRHRKKVRPVLIEAVEHPATLNLPMPDEREWKRAISRFRS
jgi:hypothetical protein